MRNEVIHLSSEILKPISVKSPVHNKTSFKLRCPIDLQLKTIADFLEKEMPQLPPGDIIDVGAGESPWKGWLPSHCAYKGIDIANAHEFGMSQRNENVLLYDGKTMPLDTDSFNGTICIEVLEHAQDPEFLLSEISRILKSKAPLLLSVPWSARRHHIPYDYHRFTKERLF